MIVLEAALQYIEAGVRVIPVKHRAKGPSIEGWPTLEIGAAEAPGWFNGKDQNIGGVLGPNGYADIDLDGAEAIDTAPFFLPKTRRFGHASKPFSHYFYKSPGLADSESVAARKLLAPDGGGLLELRTGGGGHAAQTILPPSTHPSGEPITWEDDTPIACVTPDELRTAFHRTGAAALLARFYPKEGSRHDASFVLGGFLAGCGIGLPYIKLFAEAVGVASGQPRDKIKDMIRTAVDGAGTEKRAGLPKMREVFGKDVAKKVADWLSYKGPQGVEDNVVALGRDRGGFIKGDNGQIIKGHPQNTRLALVRMGTTLHFNKFTGKIELAGMRPEQFNGPITDPGSIRLRLSIQEKFGFLPTEGIFREVLTDEAHQHAFHPIVDYLSSLKWDGVARIDTWLIAYGRTEDTPLNRAISRLWLAGGVRRVRKPGCKFDTMLVLESPVQGIDKSKALRTLAVRDEWFCDGLQLGSSPKETIEATSGKWIVEFGELSGMQRRDRESILTFLSRQEDEARAAYARYTERVPRQFICAATTNKTQYLTQDERRVLSVRVEKFDTMALLRDRDQLWAEAAHVEALGLDEDIILPESLWKDAAEVRGDRRIQNPFVPVIRKYLEDQGLTSSVTAEQAWTAIGEECFVDGSGKKERRPVSTERRPRLCTLLGEAMSDLGYEGKRDWSRGQNRGNVLYKKPDTGDEQKAEFDEPL